MTNPSFPLKTSSTLPRGHFPRWTFRPRSIPIGREGRGFNHLFLSCRVCKYFFDHRFQTMSDKYWTWRQRRLLHMPSFEKTFDVKLRLDCSSNKWFGVIGSRTLGSLLTGVSGLLWRMPWTSVIRVLRDSSETICSPSKAARFLHTDMITRFQIPPMCEAVGGLNFKRCSSVGGIPESIFDSSSLGIRRFLFLWLWNWCRYHYRLFPVFPWDC